ncbi:MAG: hypothetical protein ABI741_04295 [Ferruginibacter sp.]
MPIEQFFSKKDGITVNTGGGFTSLQCGGVVPDKIDWTDAEIVVNTFKQFSSDIQLGEILSFVLEEGSVTRLFQQFPAGTNDKAVRIYLAYCNTDKTIRAIAVAASKNSTGVYDDFNIPQLMAGTVLPTLPIIENLRPCPPQCGKVNVLNRPLP